MSTAWGWVVKNAPRVFGSPVAKVTRAFVGGYRAGRWMNRNLPRAWGSRKPLSDSLGDGAWRVTVATKDAIRSAGAKIIQREARRGPINVGDRRPFDLK